MRKILIFMIALLILSLTACSEAPKEYIVNEPVVKEQSIFTDETESIEEVEQENISTEEVEDASTPIESVQMENATIEDALYIGNANSFKFHALDCSSVDNMNESNKVFFKTRQEAIEKGFIPCKRCNP